MKIMWAFSAILLWLPLQAQTKAVTEEGTEVILFDNGTWKFVNESDTNTLENISANPGKFEKKAEQSELIKSRRLDAGLFYDPKKWKILVQSVNPNIEYYFRETGGENILFGFMTTEKLQIADLKNLKKLVLTGVQKNADYFRLKVSEYRTVNGLKVLYLRYAANVQGMDFEYGIYYYLNAAGYCAVACYTPMNEFEKHLPEIERFLNGIVKSDREKVQEVIYSSPPPPMKKPAVP